MKRLVFKYLIAAATLGLLMQYGCQQNDSMPVPILETSTRSLRLTKENQSLSIILRNIGDDVLHWRVFNKPDWAIIADLMGEIPAEDSTEINVVGDLSIGIGEYTDSLEIRSDGGSAVVHLLLSVDIKIPANGIYAGQTEEGLSLKYLIDYDQVRNFQGYFFDGAVVRVEHLPLFGVIRYTDTLFYMTGDHEYLLTGSFDGIKTIDGIWEFGDGRIIGYRVSKQD